MNQETKYDIIELVRGYVGVALMAYLQYNHFL